MGQYEQACKSKYKGYFQTYTLKTEVVKNHWGLKEDQEIYRDILELKTSTYAKKCQSLNYLPGARESQKGI